MCTGQARLDGARTRPRRWLDAPGRAERARVRAHVEAAPASEEGRRGRGAAGQGRGRAGARGKGAGQGKTVPAAAPAGPRPGAPGASGQPRSLARSLETVTLAGAHCQWQRPHSCSGSELATGRLRLPTRPAGGGPARGLCQRRVSGQAPSQIRYIITRPKSVAMRVTRQLGLPPTRRYRRV